MQVFNVKNFGANGNDNIDDTASIQAALDAARDAGGGQVYIPTGNYLISGTGSASDGGVRIHSNTELYGDGIGNTNLKVIDGYAHKMTGIIRTPVKDATENVIIRDITLDGNKANVTGMIDGIMTGYLPGSALFDNNILIERVEIHDVNRIAFNPHEQTHNIVIRDSIAHHNDWNGFVADFVIGGIYEGNIAYANGKHGFGIVTHTEDMVLRNNKSFDNGQTGIMVQRGAGSKTVEGWENMLNKNILIEFNEVYGNAGQGILFKMTESSQVMDNNIHDNGREGIYIMGSHDNVVMGNIVTNNGEGIEVRPYSGSLIGPNESYGNIIALNHIMGSKYSIIEAGDTTNNNIYSDNITDGRIKLTADAITYIESGNLDVTRINITVDESFSNTTTTTSDGYATPAITFSDEYINGTEGNDVLSASGGNDTLKGRSGDDLISGDAGDDALYGNKGDDTLIGGEGADIVKGGAGADIYVVQDISHAGDHIVDFKPHAGDMIDLSGIYQDFSTITGKTGDVLRDHLVDNGFLKFIQQGDHASVIVDMDGFGAKQGVEILTATVKDGRILDADDFIF